MNHKQAVKAIDQAHLRGELSGAARDAQQPRKYFTLTPHRQLNETEIRRLAAIGGICSDPMGAIIGDMPHTWTFASLLSFEAAKAIVAGPTVTE